MKYTALILCLLGLALASAARDDEYENHWRRFKKTFKKSYEAKDEEHHRAAFVENVHRIVSHNLFADLSEHSFHLGLNEYADMSPKEFTSVLNGYRQREHHVPSEEVFEHTGKSVPDTVDWRKKGYVTPIKNQEQCGSCWAFSTTGSLEGQHFKKTGKLVSLSEQNLVDCSGPEGNQGCEGGLMDQAFQYIEKNKGIDTEASYPYTAEDDSCEFNKAHVGATVTGFKDIPSGDEDALKEAVATVGPISVAIDASQFSFQLYTDGIYDEPECSSTALDHGVLAVGYGTEDGKDYWLVKNSWGTSWGQEGYIQMSRNKNNQCGIATQASYPIV